MHVNTTVIHNTYVDNTVVHNTTIVNNNHVAFSGGPGGINHPPTAQENAYSHEQHQAATSFQTQHQTAAMHNTANFAKNNGGHPATAAVARPMGVSAGAHANIGSQSSGAGAGKATYTPQSHGTSQPHNNTPAMHNNMPATHNPPPQHEGPPAHTGGGGQPHADGGGHEHGH
jgi:hypothetical protein